MKQVTNVTTKNNIKHLHKINNDKTTNN